MYTMCIQAWRNIQPGETVPIRFYLLYMPTAQWDARAINFLSVFQTMGISVFVTIILVIVNP